MPDNAQTMHETVGQFFGINASPRRTEALLAGVITRKNLDRLKDAQDNKWWDYRFMAPSHCFLLFAESYYKSIRTHSRNFLSLKHRDKRLVGMMGVGMLQYTVQEIWDRDPRHITTLWNAMCSADELGIPYPVYTSLAMNMAHEKGWNRIPLPSHLSSAKVAIEIEDMWRERQRTKTETAKHPFYGVRAYEGHPVQDAYRAWLIDTIKASGDKLATLYAAVNSRRQIEPGDLVGHISDSLLNRLSALAA